MESPPEVVERTAITTREYFSALLGCLTLENIGLTISKLQPEQPLAEVIPLQSKNVR